MLLRLRFLIKTDNDDDDDDVVQSFIHGSN